MTLSISNIDSVETELIGNEKQFEATVGRFTSLFNMKGIGCSSIVLEPGKKAWPYHLHYGQEELFIIISGQGTIRYNDEEYPVKSGDVIYTPPGEETAHQIVNTSKEQLKYLALSTKENPEMCYYPDSGKYGTYASDSNGDRKVFIAHESNKTTYYDGED